MTETGRDPGLADPHLTPHGRAQAQAAVAALADYRIARIITSPYRRALQTAAPIAAALGLTVEIDLSVREHKAFSCDVGSPRSVIAAEFPELDFSHLPEIWWPPENESASTVRSRADRFRAHIENTSTWDRTLVISHWGFLRSFTGETFENGEWRKLSKRS